MDKREAIEKVRRYSLLLENHFEIDSVFLFGSYASDAYNVDSDIDVAIIVNELHGDFFSTTPILWKLRREVDDRIEPILLDKNHDESGFIQEIQKSGIKII